jgi:hypothetical protein
MYVTRTILCGQAGRQRAGRGAVALKLLAGLLLVPACLLLLLAPISFVSGDGVADAALWSMFFALAGVLLGVPGVLVFLLARRPAAQQRHTVDWVRKHAPCVSVLPSGRWL